MPAQHSKCVRLSVGASFLSEAKCENVVPKHSLCPWVESWRNSRSASWFSLMFSSTVTLTLPGKVFSSERQACAWKYSQPVSAIAPWWITPTLSTSSAAAALRRRPGMASEPPAVVLMKLRREIDIALSFPFHRQSGRLGFQLSAWNGLPSEAGTLRRISRASREISTSTRMVAR